MCAMVGKMTEREIKGREKGGFFVDSMRGKKE
jgi:hypothetical protein